MSGYKKAGIITLIILVLLAFGIYKVNQLILKQLDRTGTFQKPMGGAAGQTDEVQRNHKVIEGLIIEGEKIPVVTQNLPSSPPKAHKSFEPVYEPSIDKPILIQ